MSESDRRSTVRDTPERRRQQMAVSVERRVMAQRVAETIAQIERDREANQR